VAPTAYFNKAKKITQVISAKPINKVLWPQRATIPIMFQSPEFTPIVNRLTSVAAHVVYGGGTIQFQIKAMDDSCHRTLSFCSLDEGKLTSRGPA
jgi:hypothetical protein